MTSVALHDLPDAGEADAGAREFTDRVQPLEWGEELVRVGGIKAGAVVAHVTADRSVHGRLRAKLNRRIILPGSELPGVIQQVLQTRTDTAWKFTSRRYPAGFARPYG